MSYISICEWITDNRIAANRVFRRHSGKMNELSMRIQANADQAYKTLDILSRLAKVVDLITQWQPPIELAVRQIRVDVRDAEDHRNTLEERVSKLEITIGQLEIAYREAEQVRVTLERAINYAKRKHGL